MKLEPLNSDTNQYLVNVVFNKLMYRLPLPEASSLTPNKKIIYVKDKNYLAAVRTAILSSVIIEKMHNFHAQPKVLLTWDCLMETGYLEMGGKTALFVISSRKANYILQSKALEIQFLKEQKQKLQIQIQGLKLTMNNIAYNTVGQILEGYASKGITKWSIEKILKKLEQKLDEDIVQMIDYALQSTGASIVQSRTTRSYHYPDGNYSWNYHLGNCWSFPGSQAETVIRLAKEIIPTAVTIQHISKKVSPTDEISSAPKDFAIYGLKAAEEEGIFLGQFTYDMEGFLIQTFQLKNESSELMRYIKLKVINNWGHPKYTCIYRLRVHGDLRASKNC
ncbi:SUN domain-containing protein 3, partial [Ophiophagus hannah]